MRLTIGIKLLVSACVGIAIMVAVIANQLVSNRDVAAAVDRMQKEQLILGGIGEARLGLTEMKLALREFRLAPGTAERARARSELEAAFTRGRSALDGPIAVAILPRPLQDIQSSLDRYHAAAMEFSRLYDSGRASPSAAEIERAFATRLNPAAEEATKAADESYANARRFSTRAQGEMADAVRHANVIAVLAGALALLVMLGSAVYSVLGIARPLGQIARMLNRLAAGETPRAYTTRRHRAFLLRREIGA